MKKIAAVFIFTLSFSSLFAQPTSGNFSGKENAAFKPANIGHLYGKVVGNNGKPVGDVSVIVLQSRFDTATKRNRQILVKGASTAGNGAFTIEGLPVMGKLTLQITGVGFDAYEQTISFMPEAGTAPQTTGTGAAPSFEKDLGKIQLAATAKELQGVTVTATKSLLKLDIDKKVFNVDQNIVSEGGTAVDVMKNVPSLNVDIDVNVTMRNASPTIFVDGLPTTLTLEKIPADAIETVEIMTNSSAKYDDASGGGAGILRVAQLHPAKKLTEALFSISSGVSNLCFLIS